MFGMGILKRKIVVNWKRLIEKLNNIRLLRSSVRSKVNHFRQKPNKTNILTILSFI